MTFLSQQRRYTEAARDLSVQASDYLTPLHNDIAELSPGFDGIVYFAVDGWHPNNASAVATVQPESGDQERYAFYKEKIAKHRVDLGATALGTALNMQSPQFLPSRMNPAHHITWAERSIVDDTLVGGVQAAFNTSHSSVLPSPKQLHSIYERHDTAISAVAADFHNLSKKLVSIGDTLELLAPATPNAYIISWDLEGSTKLVEGKYGAVRNYLLDIKQQFINSYFKDHSTYIHDTGDGQDIALYLPGGIDPSSPQSLRRFGNEKVLPLVQQLKEHSQELGLDYQDISPSLHFSIALGYVEQDRFDGNTSQEYWQVAKANKKYPTGVTGLTPNAREVLDGLVSED